MEFLQIENLRFFHPCLSQRDYGDFFTIYYFQINRSFAQTLPNVLTRAVKWLESIYNIKIRRKIYLFLYPSKVEMDEAFGRAMPNDQCCFVPIKKEFYLITFSAKISKDSIEHVLIHELSHIFFNDITSNYKINETEQAVPVWLDEGMALYLDSHFRKNVKELEKKRLKTVKEKSLSYYPDLADMFAYFNTVDGDIEFGPKGQLYYAFSYFCVTELIRMFGQKKIVRFCKNINPVADFEFHFESTFSMSLANFNKGVLDQLLRN